MIRGPPYGRVEIAACLVRSWFRGRRGFPEYQTARVRFVSRWNSLAAAHGKLDDEARATGLIVFNPDPAFVIGDDVAHDRKPQPGASRAGRELRQEEFVAISAAYPMTGVCNNQPH